MIKIHKNKYITIYIDEFRKVHFVWWGDCQNGTTDIGSYGVLHAIYDMEFDDHHSYSHEYSEYVYVKASYAKYKPFVVNLFSCGVTCLMWLKSVCGFFFTLC